MTYTYRQNVGGDDCDDNDESDDDDDGECGELADHYNDDDSDDCDDDDDNGDGDDDDNFFHTKTWGGVDSAYAACCSDVGFELIRIGWGLIQPMASSSRADSAAHSLCLLRASLCVSLVSCSLLNEVLANAEVGDLGDGCWASAGAGV